MPVCAVTVCGESSVTTCFTGAPITFHKFPTDPELRTRWITALRRRRMTPTKKSFVCSMHFEPNCFEMDEDVLRLRKDAVPTLYLPVPSRLFSRKHISRFGGDMYDPESTDTDSDSDNNYSFARLRAFLNKPRKRADVEEIISALCDKGFITAEMGETLHSLGLKNKDIAVATRARRLGIGRQTKPVYSAKVKAFALKVICYSPEGYEYIRNRFETRFPPTRVVNNWFTFNPRRGEFCAKVQFRNDRELCIYQFTKIIL